jgi:hypothetical protein
VSLPTRQLLVFYSFSSFAKQQKKTYCHKYVFGIYSAVDDWWIRNLSCSMPRKRWLARDFVKADYNQCCYVWSDSDSCPTSFAGDSFPIPDDIVYFVIQPESKGSRTSRAGSFYPIPDGMWVCFDSLCVCLSLSLSFSLSLSLSLPLSLCTYTYIYIYIHICVYITM